MARRALTVRLDEEAHRLIGEEATRQGVSVGRYIREAAIARAAYERGQRSAEPGRTMLRIIERLKR